MKNLLARQRQDGFFSVRFKSAAGKLTAAQLTRRFYSDRAVEELVPVYKKYRELGGRYVTIGSDAHKVAAVGNYFERALEFARELDLTPVTFCERKLEKF